MPIDKKAHFWSGMALCLSISLFFGATIGLFAAIAAGVAKELLDRLGFGTPDIWDAVATACGGLVGFLLIIISEST